MRQFLLTLIVLGGLGNCFSFGQAKPSRQISDPFDRYLNGVTALHPESSLQRFAHECKMDISHDQPRFAISSGGDWIAVKNLTKSLRSIESDFYSTAEVWVERSLVLTELWPISADVGSEVRVYRCFLNGKLLRAEAIDWNVPVDQADAEAWGYSRRWEPDAQGQMQKTDIGFVNGMERSIRKPILNTEEEESLKWTPSLGPLRELMLPPSMVN